MTPIPHQRDPARVLADLNRSVETRDESEIDDALDAAFDVGLRPEFAPPLIQLLDLPVHRRHEDIVVGLQQLKDPRAVDSLYRAVFIKHEYLNYDNFFGLARKCTWALADIGTTEARSQLSQLASSENPLIARYAQKRLDNWEEEQERKRDHETNQSSGA